MLTKRKLIQYVNAVLKTAHISLNAFRKNGGVKPLHRLRVSLKKIRAIMILFKDYPGEPGAVPVTFEMLKSLNKSAAGIRELDIISALIRKHGKLGMPLLRKCKRERALLAGKLKKQTDLHNLQLSRFQKLITNYLVAVPDPIIAERCNSVISGINKAILQALRNKTNQLHRARKNLKAISYIHEILHPKVKKELHLNLKYADKTQHIIGQWHDCVDALAYLRKNKNGNADFRKIIFQRREKKLKELKLLIKVNRLINGVN